MTHTDSNNLTIASFRHKGRQYEVDELLDSSDRDNGFGEYDIFDVTNGEEYVGHVSSDIGIGKMVIPLAKWELDNNKL